METVEEQRRLTVEDAEAHEDKEGDAEEADVNSDQEGGVANGGGDGTLNLDESEQKGTASEKSG